ncbi:hypothetical protein DPM19_13125 [Actinomadura craniellae]|uniref:Uncharacterized protein n=1 Tax=Actinomadura craniellae TaxID=2231787 RepID=A0A365H6M4_9ACTN|nr:hypothetical protein [Actinomadura craniellae]RAY14689.1 hypothetical protein DPM19_13125 [Actinomadura craniellae]
MVRVSKPGPSGLWSWEVRDGAGLGAVGVTDDRSRARALLARALEVAPVGATGYLCRVGLHPVRSRYEYGPVLVVGTATGGGVTWT